MVCIAIPEPQHGAEQCRGVEFICELMQRPLKPENKKPEDLEPLPELF